VDPSFVVDDERRASFVALASGVAERGRERRDLIGGADVSVERR
jgi:hypothetical protein